MKAIVVIDEMPKDCEDCTFGFDYRCYMTWKQFEEKEDEEHRMTTYPRPSWCPLKPMPDRKEQGYPTDDYTIGKADGWNACLYEILGETE